MSKEIVKACVKYNDRLYTGFEHGECFDKLNDNNTIIVFEKTEQGFIDNDGNFVDRKQAMIIARESGQLSYETDKQTLISEDLHLDWLHKQDQKIKDLEHRLSNCIELPIPIGEKCWTINCYKTYGDVKKGEPYYATRYELHENIVSGYNIYKSMINDKLTLNVVPLAKTNYTGVQPYLFATEEKAKAKLEEMKNG